MRFWESTSIPRTATFVAPPHVSKDLPSDPIKTGATEGGAEPHGSSMILGEATAHGICEVSCYY